jgi:hypothetical protein
MYHIDYKVFILFFRIIISKYDKIDADCTLLFMPIHGFTEKRNADITAYFKFIPGFKFHKAFLVFPFLNTCLSHIILPAYVPDVVFISLLCSFLVLGSVT